MGIGLSIISAFCIFFFFKALKKKKKHKCKINLVLNIVGGSISSTLCNLDVTKVILMYVTLLSTVVA